MIKLFALYTILSIVIRNVEPHLLPYVRTFGLQREAEQNIAQPLLIFGSEFQISPATQRVPTIQPVFTLASDLAPSSIRIVSPPQIIRTEHVSNVEPNVHHSGPSIKIKKIVKSKAIKKKILPRTMTLNPQYISALNDQKFTLRHAQDFNGERQIIQFEPVEPISSHFSPYGHHFIIFSSTPLRLFTPKNDNLPAVSDEGILMPDSDEDIENDQDKVTLEGSYNPEAIELPTLPLEHDVASVLTNKLTKTEATSSLLNEVAKDECVKDEITKDDVKNDANDENVKEEDAKNENVKDEIVKDEDDENISKDIEVSTDTSTTSLPPSVIHTEESTLMSKPQVEETTADVNEPSKEAKISLVEFDESKKDEEEEEAVTESLLGETNENNREDEKEAKESITESPLITLVSKEPGEIVENFEDEVKTETTIENFDPVNLNGIVAIEKLETVSSEEENNKRSDSEDAVSKVDLETATTDSIVNNKDLEDKVKSEDILVPMKTEASTVASESEEHMLSSSGTEMNDKNLYNPVSLDESVEDRTLNETSADAVRSNETNLEVAHEMPFDHLVDPTFLGPLYGDILYEYSPYNNPIEKEESYTI